MQKGRLVAIIVESILVLLGFSIMLPIMGFPVGDAWEAWSFLFTPLKIAFIYGAGILLLLYLYGKKQISKKWRYWLVLDYILAIIPSTVYFLIFTVFDLFGVV